jgi:hypothetical protein
MNVPQYLFRLVFWFAAGWLLAGAVAHPAGATGWGLLLGAAVAVGLTGNAAAAVGGGAGLLVHGADGRITAIVVLAVLGTVVGTAAILRRLPSWVPTRVGTLVAVTAVAFGHGAVGVLAAGILAVADLVFRTVATVTLSQQRRREVAFGAVAWIAGAAVLAHGPAGTAFVQSWSDLIDCAAVLVAAIVIALLGFNLYTRVLLYRLPRVVLSPRRRVRMVFTVAYGPVFGVLWFAVFASTVFYPDPRVAGASALVAAGILILLTAGGLAMTVGQAFRTKRVDASYLRLGGVLLDYLAARLVEFEALTHARGTGPELGEVRREWVEDAAGNLSRVGVGLPLALLGIARRLLVGDLPSPVMSWLPRAYPLLPTILIRELCERADGLLDLLGEPSADASEQMRKAWDDVYAARVSATNLFGLAALLQGHVEDAAAAFARGAGIARDAGLTDLRCIMLVQRLAALGTPEEPAAGELARAVVDPRVVDPLRRQIRLTLAGLYAIAGDRANAQRVLDLPDPAPADGEPVANQPDRLVKRREPGVGGRYVMALQYGDVWVQVPTLESTDAGVARVAAILERGLAGLDEFGTALLHTGVLRNVVWDALPLNEQPQIMAALSKLEGADPASGGRALRDVADRLARRGLTVLAAELLEAAGDRLAVAHPAQAVDAFTRARTTRDGLRGTLLDSSLRVTVSATAERAQRQLIGLLAAQPGRCVAGAGSAAVVAFDEVEAARNRAMLDLLGERVPRPPLPGLAEAIRLRVRLQRIERALSRYGRRGVPLGTTWRRARLFYGKCFQLAAAHKAWRVYLRGQRAAGRDDEVLRLLATEVLAERAAAAEPAGSSDHLTARENVWRCWEKLAKADGPAAEYAALRMGRPLTFREVRALLESPEG